MTAISITVSNESTNVPSLYEAIHDQILMNLDAGLDVDIVDTAQTYNDGIDVDVVYDEAEFSLLDEETRALVETQIAEAIQGNTNGPVRFRVNGEAEVWTWDVEEGRPIIDHVDDRHDRIDSILDVIDEIEQMLY